MDTNQSTPSTLFTNMKQRALQLRTEPLVNRKTRLKKLRLWILANRTKIHEAVYKDFRKTASEVDGVEIFHVLNEIKYALQNLDQWAAPKKIDAPITMLGTRSFIQYEPRGVCLVISPWNYPFSLAVGPVVSALAAGNAVIIKPSDLSPNTAALLEAMTKEVFEESIVSTCTGAVEVAQQLLELPFDHIFFTGSPAVGKIVMQAAAKNLSSITLELGGKSPTLVTPSAKLEEAALRIVVAKFVNNGQTCVAPDYILVHEKLSAAFTDALIRQLKQRFIPGGENFQSSTNYCRIVNERHFHRVRDLIQDAIANGAKVEYGGEADVTDRFIHPTILSNINPECKLMQEEIFGPVLPIIRYTNLDEAIALINKKPKPLALYVFSDKRDEQQQVIKQTSSGAVCINECAIHFLHHHLPFGGVNNSGMGKSHGHTGFIAFSNEKPVMKQRHGFTSIQLFYPPFTSLSKKLMDWFLKLY